MTVTWSDLAQQSLVEISQYISGNFSSAVAKNSIRGIRETARLLSTSPHLGSPVEGLEAFGDVRSLAYRQNKIYYVVYENHVNVVIVWDGRRSPARLESLLLDYFIRL